MRPTKYSAQMRKNLCKWIEQGCTFKDACTIEGISFQTFNEWQKQKPEFSDSIKKAKTLCKQTRIALVLRAGEKDWKAAAWWLERNFPDEFSLQPKLRVQVEDQSEDPADKLFALLRDRAMSRGKKVKKK